MLLGALLGCTGGCAADVDAGEPTVDRGSGGTSAPSGQVPIPSDEHGVEVQFEPSTPVELVPREEHEIQVVVRPAGAHTVRFALVDARDGALDQGTIVTDVSGRGSVWLTAPSTLGAFSLRAQVGSHTSTLSLSVSARPFTTLEVVPRYSGRRPVNEWVASIHVGRDCGNFPVIPPDDDELFARVAADKTAVIASVPVGPTLAVTVRAGQFAGGCYALSAPRGQDRLRVEVPVHDRAVDLENTELEIALGVGGKDPAFLALLESGRTKLRNALLGNAESEASALLDSMEDALESNVRTAFRARRAELAWDTAFGANGLKLIPAVERWVQVGQSSLLSERAFEGRLSSTPSPDDAGKSTLSLAIARIAEHPASDVDAEVSEATWTADASDALAVSARLRFGHTALVSALAREPAIAETGTQDVPKALARVVDCAGITARLTNTGRAPIAESCDASCVTRACEEALEAMWSRAVDEGTAANLSIAAAGSTRVGNQAQAVDLTGTWVGKLEFDGESLTTQGTIRGAAPRYTAR